MKDFSIEFVTKEFEELIIATQNSINQDKSLSFWKTDFGKHLVLRNFQLAYNYFRSVLLISENDDETLLITVTPLTRASLEILFSIIYLLENFEIRTLDSAKSFYREGCREIRELKNIYSGKSVDWDTWIRVKTGNLETIKTQFENEFSVHGYSEFDWENDNNQFPRLGKMKKSFDENSETFKFLKFLDDIYNRELSGISHSEPFAVALFSSILHKNGEIIRKQYKGKNIGLCLVILIGLISEIENNLNYGVKPRLRELWNKLVNLSDTDIAKEFYEMRYKNLLSE